ncbi:TetR/AcrR family transcriptional regulator [Catelliglobosispora koreensis]|uniref:TetR/AcrR family transcriptional regulator n=1 Tax=Catelliglobosispora koreensis TaxID=129052 RepID=UPI00037F166C|nr:TetR/AcrR family transcriptional regulator [Catelliglobosispora koreensis]
MERADATRNRVLVLEAARRLFTSQDPRSVTMEDIAREAGVGRATLYRRYPDVPTIAAALLGEHESALQAELIGGPPPLGPGAPPAQRLAAFYTAMIALLEEHLPLVLGAETGEARFRAGAYGFWRAHVKAILTEAGVKDALAATDVLLAPLAPDVYRYQRQVLGYSQARVTRAVIWLAQACLPDD